MTDAPMQVEKIAHSVLGASSSSRWMNCPGSIRLAAEYGITHSDSSVAAREGTVAHEILSKCLSSDTPTEPWEYTGTKVVVEGQTFIVDDDMVSALSTAYNHMHNVIAEAYKKTNRVMTLVEVSLKHTDIDDMFGTTDHAVVVFLENGMVDIIINDYKHGKGVVVEPTSSQIKYYAVLVIDHLIQKGSIEDFHQVNNVTLTIMQPRIPHADGVIRSINMTGMELKEWFNDELIPAMHQTKQPDAIIQPGEWCKFCPVKNRCPVIDEAVSNMVVRPPNEMSNDELGEMMDKIKAIMAMKDEYEYEAFKRAINGGKIKGYKLVNKKANRVWKDDAEEKLKKAFGNDAYQTKLKSPPEIEKLPDGRRLVVLHAYTPDAGLTLAPLSDKRKEHVSLLDEIGEL